MSEMNDALECSVCLQPYNKDDKCPRLLSCGHTYCSSCLQKIMKDRRISCPQDRSDTLASGGVQCLQRNFALLSLVRDESGRKSADMEILCELCGDEGHPARSFCLDCGQAMCEAAEIFHKKFRSSRHHKIVAASLSNKNPAISFFSSICSVHDQPYRFYDLKCKCVICVDCFALSHCGHECQSLPDAAASCQQEVQQLCNEAKEVAALARASEERISGVLCVLEQNYQEASQKLSEMFGEILNSVATRRDQLSTNLRHVYERKVDVLQEQTERLQTLQDCLCSAVEITTAAISCGGAVPLLLAYSDITNTLLTNDSESAEQEPAKTDHINFRDDLENLGNAVVRFVDDGNDVVGYENDNDDDDGNDDGEERADNDFGDCSNIQDYPDNSDDDDDSSDGDESAGDGYFSNVPCGGFSNIQDNADDNGDDDDDTKDREYNDDHDSDAYNSINDGDESDAVNENKDDEDADGKNDGVRIAELFRRCRYLIDRFNSL